jgi:acyl carrier protein
MNDFLAEMAEILEADDVAADAVLEAFDAWDSLAVLSVVAMADTSFDVKVTAQEVRKVKTVQALYALIVGRRAAA